MFEEELVEVGEEVAINIDNEVIMKTASTILQKNVTGKEDVANALLDTGAKRTFITMEKARKLGLRWGPPTIVKLNTFGSNNSNDICINVTTLAIRMKNGSKKLIQAKICKTITGAMLRQRFNVNKYKQIWKDLDMADNN